jgi:hypothetical protein
MATSLSKAISLDAKGRIVVSQLADFVTSTVGAQSKRRRKFAAAEKNQNVLRTL